MWKWGSDRDSRTNNQISLYVATHQFYIETGERTIKISLYVATRQFYIETAERTSKVSLYVATRQVLHASGHLKRLFFSVTDVLLLLYAVGVPVLTFPVSVSNTQIHGSTPGGTRYPLVTLYRLIPLMITHVCHVHNGQTDSEEHCAVLGYYAASNGNSFPTFRDNLLSHLQVHGARCHFQPQLLWLYDTFV